jgi:peptidoglycan/xylan/chitin deacetylase (PgdA/CDA1 family)
MIRELPRGPFDAYLRAHYSSGKATMMPRFAMGCGAIFMIQRVRPASASLAASSLLEETDPTLLEEMLALVAVQRLVTVPIGEVNARLASRDHEERFVSFTFDGAYRSVLEMAYPLFKAKGIPFAVFVASDFLDTGNIPWWMALEALVHGNDRLSMETEDINELIACQTPAEKQTAYSRLLQQLSSMDSLRRAATVTEECARHGVDLAAFARREMLSVAEIKALAQDDLVTIGSLAGGTHALSALDFDSARDSILQSLDKIEAEIGIRPRHLAFPGGHSANVTARDVKIASYFNFDSAVTPLEGALWPEHAGELLALPRIALDNDPATLMRALMLSGSYETLRRAIA